MEDTGFVVSNENHKVKNRLTALICNGCNDLSKHEAINIP